MLSYRHGFHAGNYADVLKHSVLVASLQYLQRKASPIVYFDTHAGGGCYDLTSEMANKTAEALAGVLKLDFDQLPDFADGYRQAVSTYLQQDQYPGSPQIAADLLRPGDKIRLFELHPSEVKTLQARWGRDRRILIQPADGFAGLTAMLPIQNARALVLMDPPYEVKTDYQQVASTIAEAYRRMPHGNFLIWYPVVQRQWVDDMISRLLNQGVKDCWQYELGIAADGSQKGMTASGLLAINPPWTLAEQLREALPVLQQQLAPSSGFWRVEQLAAE